MDGTAEAVKRPGWEERLRDNPGNQDSAELGHPPVLLRQAASRLGDIVRSSLDRMSQHNRL